MENRQGKYFFNLPNPNINDFCFNQKDVYLNINELIRLFSKLFFKVGNTGEPLSLEKSTKYFFFYLMRETETIKKYIKKRYKINID